MNTQQQLLLVVGLLLMLPSNATEQNDGSSAFPPNNVSVEKNAETSTNKNIATPKTAIAEKNTNPWGGGALPVKAEKQYPSNPPVAKNILQPAASVPMPVNVQPPYNTPSNFQQPNFQRSAPMPMAGNFPPTAFAPRNMGYQMPNTNFSNMSPFGNSFSPNSFFNNGAMPTPWSNAGGMNPWRNNNNSALPPFFSNPVNTGRKKAWGDIRHIWPDFYTDFTDEAWDKSVNAPYDMGRMPGGWRAPSLSSPDPVTVGDAVTNQFPPMLEEMGNMMNFAN
jgi:hypothetical protein